MPPLAPTPAPEATVLSKHPSASRESAGAANNTLLPPVSLRKKPSAGILTTGTTASGTRTAHITTTATACPAAAAAAAATASRHPLRLRDQNAALAFRAVKPGPESTPRLSTAARMPPYERASATGHRQPTAARAVNKPPLTPKIATRSQPPQHPHATLATTPLARRPPPESTLSANGAAPRDREDLLTSPVSAFLSTNVTPRSGSRQSRVDSANSTPNGTPNPDRHDPWETRSSVGISASGPDDTMRRPVVTFSSPSDAGGGARADRDSKFFYASDAQKQPQQVAQAKPFATQQQKPSTFFYANGNTVPERQDAAVPGPLSPGLSASSSTQDSLMSKFVYANGAPELQPPAKIGPSSKRLSGSVISTASRLPPSRQANPPRATSPVKAPPSLTPKNSTTPTVLSPRSPVSATTPQGGSHASHARLSAEIPSRPARSHTRTKSLAGTEPSIAAARRIYSHGSVPSSGRTSPSNPSHPPPGTEPSDTASSGFASLLQAAEDFAEPEEAKSESLNSPTKTSQDGQVTDLVANARRERKVQDLEITNASLEAINRTLERQLRKQTAELRRYKRLSRSGRLSISSIGSRIPSDSTVDGGGLARAGMGLDDLSEEESEIEAEDAEMEELEEEDDLSSSEASGESSLEVTAVRDTRHRQRAERRLELDISKHQQLLIDSQKINQSLKRCLGWTEELIKEGKRALAYQVRVSDVELGGRVLPPEEIERREAEAEGEAVGDGIEVVDYQYDLLYQDDSQLAVELVAEADTHPWSKGPQDRDSGIELPTDGG
ncbi:hypothetical protein MFIFM68171_07557 [Madurella fahalii]|uniref:Uncharacterized protein n=1 Tax=Madurella fahalii TaxID=1157608 RepID=A0ABQ0GHV6_9PEZI